MHEAIPKKYFPPLRFQRRWPALADLENNPFFLLWYYKRRRKRLLDKLSYKMLTAQFKGLIPILVLLAYVLIAPLFIWLGRIIWWLPGFILLSFSFLVIRAYSIHTNFRKSIAPLYRITTKATMQDVCLTPVDHELAIIGLIAPNISRHAFFLGTLSAGLALAVDFGLLYYFSFPAIHYFIHLAIASILYYCHFRFHDGISLFQIRCTFKERTQFKKRISASSFLQPLMYDKFLAFCATALIMLTFALFIMVILKAGTLSILGSKIQICITLVLIIATPCYSFISSFHYSHAEENLAAAAEYSRMLLQVAAAGEVGRK